MSSPTPNRYACAEIEKINEEGFASVCVEVVPSGVFQIRCDLITPIQVVTVEGEAVRPGGIEIACMSVHEIRPACFSAC